MSSVYYHYALLYLLQYSLRAKYHKIAEYWYWRWEMILVQIATNLNQQIRMGGKRGIHFSCQDNRVWLRVPWFHDWFTFISLFQFLGENHRNQLHPSVFLWIVLCSFPSSSLLRQKMWFLLTNPIVSIFYAGKNRNLHPLELPSHYQSLQLQLDQSLQLQLGDRVSRELRKCVL